jgi:hypothetical protein
MVAALAIAGSASAVTYDFSTFTLDVNLDDFAGTSVSQSAKGFTFGGYAIGSLGVSNLIDFTVQVKAGNKLDLLSFIDSGTFSGSNVKFNVADNFSDIATSTDKIGGKWSFTASTSDVLKGYIAYDLKSKAGFSSASNGGSFSVTTLPVPEPESYAMFLAGLGIMGFVARRRKNG